MFRRARRQVSDEGMRALGGSACGLARGRTCHQAHCAPFLATGEWPPVRHCFARCGVTCGSTSVPRDACQVQGIPTARSGP